MHCSHLSLQFFARLGVVVLTMAVSSVWADTDPPVRQEIRDCKNCPDLIVVPDGSFQMGVPDSWTGHEKSMPRHQVQIRAFALGKYEVTRKEWRAVMGADPAFVPDPKCGDRCPIDYVNRAQVMEFLLRLSKLTGKPYRLPSESEWEYACKAGTRLAYCGGDQVEDVACVLTDTNNWKTFTCYSDDEKRRLVSNPNSVSRHTLPVGSKRPNAWGFFDMSGNAREMIQDCWNPNYSEAPNDGSAWLTGDCKRPVVRGGAFWRGDFYGRFFARDSEEATLFAQGLGFRVVRDIVPGETLTMSNADSIPASRLPSRTAPRFAISSDGQEVLDSTSSLIWRRCVEGMTLVGSTCTGTAGKYTYKQAVQQITGEVDKTNKPWRLPTLEELMALRTPADGTPLDPSVFPETPTQKFWSATEAAYGGDARGRWVIDFVSPLAESAGMSDAFTQHRLRLVRDRP